VIVTPTESVARCPKLSTNAIVHAPEPCAVTVNAAGALADDGVTLAIPAHAPASGTIAPAYPASLAVTLALVPASVNVALLCESATGPPGGGVGEGVGVGAGATNAGAGDPPLPPPPHPHASAHPASVRPNVMKKRRARRTDRSGIRVLPVAHGSCADHEALRERSCVRLVTCA
jgi:hypothetical protein